LTSTAIINFLKKKKRESERFVKSAASALVDIKSFVGFEVFTAVTMKNAVFWDVAP
jgi:hypothetical protein